MAEPTQSEYYEVDYWFCGTYLGKILVGKDSLVGRMLSLDMAGAAKVARDMQDDLAELGASAAMEIEPA